MKANVHYNIGLGFLIIALASCAAVKSTVRATPAAVGPGFVTAVHRDLISLPPPELPVVVAVYKFKDQTGQYKTNPNATSFSTAVTQGGTSMLIKALEESGWFIPIEREGLPNLLNERKIIRSTRLQAGDQTELPPLLFGGVILEGGIISYETNVITGGIGARYFGLGGSVESRQDKVTIYLRAVSTQNGQVLKSVSTTKSILSREVDVGVYRFVSVQRLLEVEAGFSTNEPPQMCVLEAIEKAVIGLVAEGIRDGLWKLQNPEDANAPALQRYWQEKKAQEQVATVPRNDKEDVVTRQSSGKERR